MPPWSGHLTWNTQTVLIVVCVLAGIMLVGSILYILYDEPPKQEADKRKPSPLPQAPPSPPLTLGPRFAQIEAWKREQEGDKPFLPDVLRLGTHSLVPTAPPVPDPPAAAPSEEEDWLTDRVRPADTQTRAPQEAPLSGIEDQTARAGTVIEPASRSEAELAPEEAGEEVLAGEAELAAATREADQELLPPLRPVRLSFPVEELAADRAEESEEEPEEKAERVPAESVEGGRPSLRPVQLDWLTSDLWVEPEPAVPSVQLRAETGQPGGEEPELLPDREAEPGIGERAAAHAAGHPEAAAETLRTKDAMPLSVQALGRAQLVVFGRALEQRTNNRLELLLYLAHLATKGEDASSYVDRYTISAALWGKVAQPLESLRTAKSRLLDDLEAAGLDVQQFPCLETGPEDSLRLHPGVGSDVQALLALVRQIDQARRTGEGAAPAVTSEQLETWKTQVEQLYRGGFALQLKARPWVNNARRFYQKLYVQARFDLARLWAQLGLFPQAIDLGTDTILLVTLAPEAMMRLLVGWVKQLEPIEREQWAAHFAQEYEQHYGRTLTQANATLEELRQSVLPH